MVMVVTPLTVSVRTSGVLSALDALDAIDRTTSAVGAVGGCDNPRSVAADGFSRTARLPAEARRWRDAMASSGSALFSTGYRPNQLRRVTMAVESQKMMHR